ncbi:MAG: 50S ribosomal protein L21 [Christensenellales bacterium]|jgi:large subunit ribosomal protein L21
MYAVIKAGGTQFKVTPGDVIHVNRIDVDDETEVQFPVLMVVDGEKTTVGTPIVEGAKVTGKVLRQVKGKKLIVYKFRPKKNYRRKGGHRQLYTQVEITAVKG